MFSNVRNWGRNISGFLKDPLGTTIQEAQSLFAKVFGEKESLIVLGPVGVAVWAYIELLDKRAKGKWQRLPEAVIDTLAPHYPNINLNQVIYAEGVNTVHGQAITFGNRIYFPQKINLLKNKNDLHWMLHELEHVSQYKAHGGITPFIVKYVINGGLKILQNGSLNIHDAINLEQDAENKAKRIVNSVFIQFIKILRSEWTEIPYYGSIGSYFVDVTGNRKADAIVVNNNKVTVRPSTGSSFAGNQTWTNQAYFGDHGTFFADVTGNGKADAIAVNNDGVWVRESQGNKFADMAHKWTNIRYTGDRGIYFADVTGNGKADAIVVNNNHITVRCSTGASFSGNEQWTNHAYFGDHGTFFADVTGNGKADAIAVNNDGVWVRESQGNKFADTAHKWTNIRYTGHHGIYFADVTGNGKADAIVVNNNHITVRRSTGSSFSGNEQWTTGRFFGSRATFFADVTGNGKADAIAVNNRSPVRVLESNGQRFQPAGLGSARL